MNILKHHTKMPSIFSENFPDVFQGFFRPMKHTNVWDTKDFMPAVDIEEKEQEYLLHADLPGFNKDDIEVSFSDGNLFINAKHQEESESKSEDGYMLKERRLGSYSRHFVFGNNIIVNDISASYANGVLELTIPKLKQSMPEAKQKITIK